MARFYARFDSGSPSWSPDPATGILVGISADGYFNQQYIGANAAAGAILRTGLLASRSAASTDFYNELDAVNQNGALGIYCPPDLFEITNGVLTASAYTASAATTQGIITPANYRTRPTASILSGVATATMVGPTNPLDSGSVNYNVYLSASNAVTTVLNSINTSGGPFSRLGNQPSRTLHSIWHDADLQYFAWDDLTPGTPQTVTLTESSSTDFYYTNDFYVEMNWGPTYQYLNDTLATPRVRFEIVRTGQSAAQTLNKTSLSAGTLSYQWQILASNINSGGDGEYTISYAVNFRDAQVISEGGTNIGDGVEAGGSGSAINLTRLYPVTLAFKDSPFSATCADYTGATTRYTTRANPTSAGQIQVGDPLYVATDVVSVSSLGIGFYRNTSTNEIYELQGGGVESPIQTCT